MKKFEELYMYSTSPRHVTWYGGIQAMIFACGCCILGDAFLDITCKDFSGCNIITQLAVYTAYIRYILSSRGLFNPQLPITRT